MKEEILIIFGKKLRQERLNKGISQETLAEKADLHRTYIGMVERGEKNITLKNMEKIVVALNSTLADFFKDI